MKKCQFGGFMYICVCKNILYNFERSIHVGRYSVVPKERSHYGKFIYIKNCNFSAILGELLGFLFSKWCQNAFAHKFFKNEFF